MRNQCYCVRCLISTELHLSVFSAKTICSKKDVNRYFEHTLISYFVKKMSEHRYDIRISEAVLIRIR